MISVILYLAIRRQAMNNYTPLKTNNKATASYMGVFRPYPVSSSQDGLGFVPPSQAYFAAFSLLR